MASDFSISPIYRILKKSGANRVSTEAAEELRKVLERIATDVANRTVELANHAGRKTVKADDVKIASKQMLNNN